MSERRGRITGMVCLHNWGKPNVLQMMLANQQVCQAEQNCGRQALWREKDENTGASVWLCLKTPEAEPVRAGTWEKTHGL